MAVSRNIEEQKKKLKAAVSAQQAAEKKSSYTFAPRVGSASSSFSDIPKQETPKETKKEYVKVEAPQRTFTPSTVMGSSFSSLPKQTTQKKTFTPSTVMSRMTGARENTFPAKRKVFVPTIVGSRESSFGNIPTYQKQRQVYQTTTANDFREKYGVDINNFSSSDLKKLMEKNHISIINYGDGTANGALHVGAKNKNDEVEYRRLARLAQYNDTRNTNPNAALTAWANFNNSVHFENVFNDKKFRKEIYSNPDDYKYVIALSDNDKFTPSQLLNTANSQHPKAAMVGSGAGDLTTMLLLGGAIGEAVEGVGWLANKPSWVTSAVKSGLTFGTQRGLSSAGRGDKATKVARETAIGALGGTVGGAASEAVGGAVGELLKNKGMRDKVIPQIARAGLEGATFSLADNASTYYLHPREERPTLAEMAKNVGVAFAFGSISSAINMGKVKAQSKAALDTIDNAMTKEYDAMLQAATRGDKAEVTRRAYKVLESAEQIEKLLNGEKVEIYANNRELYPDPIMTIEDASFVGEANRVKLMQEDLKTIKDRVTDYISASSENLKTQASSDAVPDIGSGKGLVETGLARDTQTGANRYAKRLQGKFDKGRDLSDWNVGRQFIKNVQAIESEEQFINSLSGIVPTEVTDKLYDDKGNELNGQYTGGENRRVDISANGETSIPATAKHEFTHAFKQIAPTAYQAFENYVINAAMETNAEAVNSRLQFLKENYGYSDEVAREEIAAELTGTFNTKAAEKIASGNVTLADNIISAIRTAKAQIRTAYSKGNYENSKGVQLTFEQLNNAEKLWNKALGTAAENSGQGQTEATVRYSQKGDSTEAKTIKTQIQENLDFLNTLNTVAVSTYDLGQSVKQVRQRVGEEFKKIGYKVDRQNFGVIDLGEKQINESLNYLNTDAERAALFTVPQVLKRGVEIQTTDNHKSRDYDTVTIAAPVEINGTRGIQAVVVKKVKGNRYKTHRIVMPDGSTFEFSDNKTEATSDKMTSVSESESLSIASDNNIISKNDGNVKKSVKENTFNPKRITNEVMREYDVDQRGVDSEEVERRISEAREILSRGGEENMSQAWNIVSSVGRTIAQHAQNIDSTLYENYKDLRNYIRNTPVSISEQDRADITGADSFNEFRQKNFGSLRISKNGIPIDSFYNELSEMYPNFFDAQRETHPADQLGRIQEVLENIRPTDRGYSDSEIESLTDEIAGRIFNRLGEYMSEQDIVSENEIDGTEFLSGTQKGEQLQFQDDWDRLMNGPEAQRQEELQSRERQAEFLNGAKRGEQQIFDEIAEEAQRQEDRQRAERERQERQRTEEFMRDDTLINAYNSESASRTDKKRFGKEDIVPALKKYGIGFMAREVDKLYPIKSYERFAEKQIHGKEKARFRGKNSPYVMSSNSIDAESRAKYILTEELTDFDANPIGESLADIVGDLSYDDYKDFNTYLKLRHGVEWITGDKNTDKPVWDSKILNDPAAMKAGIRQLEEKHPDFADAAKRIYKYQADLMKTWLVDTGVITQEQYDTLRNKYPHYVPFFRQDDTPSPRFRPKKGIANQGNPIMEAEGGRQRIYDPIENIMINTSRFVNAAAKNSAMQAVVNIYDTVPGMEQYMAEAVKDPETGKFKLKESGATAAEYSTEEHAEPEEYITDMVQHAIKLTDGDIVTVLQNGQKRYFKVFDADFLKAIDNLHPIQLGAVMRAVASATRVFSALATSNNPVFTLASNPIKDTQNAFVQTVQKNPFAVVTAILDAQWEQIKNSDMGKRIGQKKNSDYDGTDVYKKYMAMGGEYASAFSAGRKAMNEALNDIKPEQQGARAKAKRAVRFVPNAYGKVADAIETGPRLGEFKYSNGKAGNDVHQAHFDSKNVTLNFGRSGYVGEKINKFVPFYNPSAQGISMMIQNFKDKPLQTSLRVGTMIAISALTLALNKRNKESEEEYTNASSYLKNNYYLFHMGGGHFFKIPKSQEYGLVPSLVERAVEKYAFDNPDAFYDYTDYISSALLPSIFKAEFPFVDTGSIIGLGTYTSLLENKDFKGSPIVPDYLQDEVPAEQYDDRTSYIARWIGKALNWSPKKVDYVIKSNTGFLGKINESILHEGEKDYTLGVGTKFMADSYFSTDKPNMFYENKDTADRQAKSYPTADSTYLSKRYAQASSVLSVINKIYKEDAESEKGRQTRKAYVNYARDNKDNPSGLTDEVFKEIKGLYDEDKSILTVPEINREIKYDGASYTFDSANSVMNYQKDLNRAIDQAYRELIADVSYSTKTDSDKAAALKKAKENAVKNVKQFYVENEGKGQMPFDNAGGAIAKPSQESVETAQEKKDRKDSVTQNYVQKLSDDFQAAYPNKDGYDVDTMMKIEPTKVKVGGKEYEVSGEIANKIAAAAEDKFYDNIESFYSGDTDIDYLIGRNAKTAKYAEDANGKRAYMTGSRYNADGSKRFDETVEGKIIFKLKEAAINAAAEEYADEITGGTSTPASNEPKRVSFVPQSRNSKSSTRFRSTRRSSGGTGGGSSGRGVSVAAASVSERAARRAALEQMTGRGGGNPTIAKAIRGLKLETIKPLQLT